MYLPYAVSDINVAMVRDGFVDVTSLGFCKINTISTLGQLPVYGSPGLARGLRIVV